MAKSSFSKQFKKGTYPDQHWDESVRTNDHKETPPEKSRKRMGLAEGTDTQAMPGLDARGDIKRPRRK
jgi:hypothetical protein